MRDKHRTKVLTKPKEYFSPTLKNVVQVFFIMQVIPALLFAVAAESVTPIFLTKCEALFIGIISFWPLRPEAKMSATDLNIELKWTNRMFGLSLICLLLPVALLIFDPDSTPWSALNAFAIPVFTIVTLFSIQIKREQGGFFAPTVSTPKDLQSPPRPEVAQSEEINEDQ